MDVRASLCVLRHWQRVLFSFSSASGHVTEKPKKEFLLTDRKVQHQAPFPIEVSRRTRELQAVHRTQSKDAGGQQVGQGIISAFFKMASSSVVKRSVHWDSTPAKTAAAGAQGSSSSLTPVRGNTARDSSLSHFQPWTSPHSMPAGGFSNLSPSAAPAPSTAAVRAPTYGKSVLKSRMKWNGTALLVLSLVERLPLTRRLWW